MSSAGSPRRPRGGGFRSIDEVAVAAGDLIPRRGRGRHLQAMAAWRAAVGDRVQRVTRVARVGDDAWTVEVPDGAWGSTLQRLERPILDRFRERMGDDAPRRLEFRVAPGFWRPQERPVPSTASPAPLPPEEGGARPTGRPERPPAAPPLAEADVPVSDPELRARLRRLGARYLARRRP